MHGWISNEIGNATLFSTEIIINLRTIKKEGKENLSTFSRLFSFTFNPIQIKATLYGKS